MARTTLKPLKIWSAIFVPVEGAVLFSTTCYACHGVPGEGTSSGLQLNDAALLDRYDDDYFRDVIARGHPDRGMPTWGSVLSPVQIEDLVAYIRSWARETPAAISTLGGDANRGENIFTSTCVACHGPAGSGTDIAPPLAEAEILKDPEAFYTVISEGRLEVGMPKRLKETQKKIGRSKRLNSCISSSAPPATVLPVKVGTINLP